MEARIKSGDPNDTPLHFPSENTTVDIGLECLGNDRYRLTNFPIGACEWVKFGDIIEAIAQSDGTLQFVRRVERSPFKVHEFLLPKHVIESEAVKAMRTHIREIGGHSERVFGGMLLIAVPPGEIWDPTPELEQAFAAAREAIEDSPPSP